MTQRFVRLVSIWALMLLSLWVGISIYRDLFLVADAPRAITPRGDLAEFEKVNIELFESVSPSVVYIFSRVRLLEPFARRPQGQTGTGSGFVWDGAGHVVTNFHVVDGASEVAVKLDSGEAIPAKIVGTAPDYDLAVLRLRSRFSSLQPIPVGTSGDLQTGQAVFAIGNPYGLSRTLTTGIISALDRRLPTETGREIRGVIQTDAAINPGNSGGPLLDSAGRLIGVNTAIISGSGASAGIGFAVPVDIVNRIVPQLIATGKAPRPGIGISAASEEAAARAGIDGIIVVDVLQDGSAATAGLRGIDPQSGAIGDVITHVNGKPVRTIAEFAAELEAIGVGNPAELTVRRQGREVFVSVTVADIS
ncbi:MAG: trypsin-like peptidase domain-containing protein [Kiloniellales bacterium]|nr:trypsin-like peptidase domain-containing protein [Kiloniellales bacterium]